MLAVPSARLDRLRDGLLAEIGGAGEALQLAASNSETRETGKTRFRGPLERLRGAWALLDTVGWSTTDTQTAGMQVDLRDHHEALIRALEVSLLFAADDLTDLDKHTPEYAKGSEALAHASATASVAEFREFATTARRQIDKLIAPDQSTRR